MENRWGYALVVSLFVFGFIVPISRADSGPSSLVKQAEVDIPLRGVYVPKNGFDDNDRVEAVLAGELPSPCYTLERAYAEKMPDGRGFRVHQVAWKWNSGACATGDLIEDPVPFTTPVMLGQLATNSYEISFLKQWGGTGKAEFGVERSKTDEIDNFSYALVRDIVMEEGYKEGTEVTAELRGLLPNKCSEFADPTIQVQGDVIVVLPILKTTQQAGGCGPSPRPFKHTIRVANLKPGRYLMHVRSRGGNAVYQEFAVLEKNSAQEVQ